MSEILVVEDDVAVRAFMSLFLGEISGHTVRSVDTLAAAREFLKASEPHVLLTDQSLPDGDGLTLGLESLGTMPNLQVVVVTGSELDIESQAAASRYGISILQKPFEPDRLLNLVKRGAERG